MNHFNFKSLAFYGVAIGSVLVLFKTVTAYGESNLKAPAPINSRYQLAFTQNLPNCEKSDALILNIQQSGIYLNGYLLPVNTHVKTSTASEDKPSLTGILNNQQISLSGKVPTAVLCNIAVLPTKRNANFEDNSLNSVTIQIQLNEGSTPQGQLTVGGNSENIGFTAVPQKSSEEPNNSSSH